ncbi:unnamed protein product [Withania somnifera]
MLEIRDEIEKDISWEKNTGSSNMWFDNWTGMGPLYIQDHSSFMIEEDWNQPLLQQHLLQDIADTGRFTVKSAQDTTRQRNRELDYYKKMWIDRLPYKTSFFLWRLSKRKLPVDDIIARCGIAMVTRCRCCDLPHQGTISHLFLEGQFVKEIWHYFTSAAGVLDPSLHLNQAITKWWDTNCVPKLKPLYQAAPANILWQVWKWRNTVLYGGNMTKNRVIYEINWNFHMLARIKYPWLSNIPFDWVHIIKFFEDYRPRIRSLQITWTKPLLVGNPGPSSIAFCTRDHQGDFVYSRAKQIEETTNMCVETKAIKEGVEYCYTKGLWPLIIETDCLAMVNF